MLRHLLIGLTFVTAFTFAGVGVSNTAEAWRGWGRPYVAYYGGPPRSYYYRGYAPGYAPYRTYYSGPRYYRPYNRGYYYAEPGYYYGPRSGVSVSYGF
jgi:hypothetical protein